jgi:circadian clock protein KaiC
VALMRCTAVLLALGDAEGAGAAGFDGVLELFHEPVASRDVRWLRVAKLRGSASLTGRHQFGIGEGGVEVYPRLEAALSGAAPAKGEAGDRAGFGVPGLDAMLAGGLPRPSSTLVLGTPGAGKTVLGLHFAAEGARRGEPGLIAGFHETAAALADTAAGVGLDLGRHIEAGLVRVLWQPPLERSPDAWAWALLAAVEEHRPRRLVVDAFTDAMRLFAVPQRQGAFLQALANELRARGVTVLFVVEIDTYVSAELATPFPAVSGTMDNGILLRSVELRSRLHRLVSVLKMRQSGFDPAIRRFAIGAGGMEIGEPFDEAAGLLTGRGDPVP